MGRGGLPVKAAKYARLLATLQRVDNHTKLAVLSSAKKDLIETLVACARAIVKRKVPLSDAHYRALRAKAADLSDLIRPRLSLAEKRKVLQRGGFLASLIAPVLQLLPQVLGGITGLLNPRR